MGLMLLKNFFRHSFLNQKVIAIAFFVFSFLSFRKASVVKLDYLNISNIVLDFTVAPKNASDKSALMFSDQASWFAYSFPNTNKNLKEFSGPFLMTQQNGVWASVMLCRLVLMDGTYNDSLFNSKNDLVSQNSYAGHLEKGKPIRVNYHPLTGQGLHA